MRKFDFYLDKATNATMAAKICYSSVIFLCILYCVTSFNLEPRIPVIKFGEPGSYFGFSVAEHLTFGSNGENISW